MCNDEHQSSPAQIPNCKKVIRLFYSNSKTNCMQQHMATLTTNAVPRKLNDSCRNKKKGKVMLAGRSYLEHRQTTELASGERKGSGLGESGSSPMDGFLRWKIALSEFCWLLMKFSKRFPILLPAPSTLPPSLLLPLLLASSMLETTLITSSLSLSLSLSS